MTSTDPGSYRKSKVLKTQSHHGDQSLQHIRSTFHREGRAQCRHLIYTEQRQKCREPRPEASVVDVGHLQESLSVVAVFEDPSC
jgi:hypothetical protein